MTPTMVVGGSTGMERSVPTASPSFRISAPTSPVSQEPEHPATRGRLRTDLTVVPAHVRPAAAEGEEAVTGQGPADLATLGSAAAVTPSTCKRGWTS